MTALPSIRRTFTPEEYLLIERHAPYRSEFLDGEIYAMAGATRKHNTIVGNLTAELQVRLKGTPCQVMSSDMKVDTRRGGLYSYPDLLIVCGEQKYLDSTEDVLLNPTVLIEVLSPSTEKYDRITKFARYKHIKTLREYVLVSQDSVRIDRYFLDPSGNWPLSTVAGPESSLVLESVPVSIALRDIYDRISFAEDAEPSES